MGSSEHRRGGSSPSDDRRRWGRMFGALVEILRSEQAKMESLAGDRRLLERYVHLLHDGWTADRRRLVSQIAEMKKVESVRSRVDASWLDLLVGLKQKEALFYKTRWEVAESDSKDLHECLESVSAAQGQRVEVGNLQSELEKWKRDYEELSSKKESEISSLLRERDFVWNQFNEMEKKCSGVEKTKGIETQQAGEAVAKLHDSLQELRLENGEKDAAIAKLTAENDRLRRRHAQEASQSKEHLERMELDMQELRSSAVYKDKKVEDLTKQIVRLEMDLKRSIKAASVPPNGRNSTRTEEGVDDLTTTPAGKGHSRAQSGKRKRHGASCNPRPSLVSGDDVLPKTRTPANVGLSRCSKGKRTSTRTRSSPPSERPSMLFSANFRVPKVKCSSPSALSS